jgi:hypothetical protein
MPQATAPIDRLILHIGTFKTGTSSIQQFLGANVDALQNAGICYPLAGRRPGANVPGHHRLSSTVGKAVVSDGTDFQELASQIREEYACSGCGTLFLSSEEFSSIHRPGLLFEAFPAKRVEIVASFRPQYDIATALYFTAVIGDRVTAFPEEYLAKTLRPFFLNYRDTLVRWRSARPDATIHVRRFEKGTPARTDAVADLVATLGLPLSTVRPAEDFRIHQTLPARGTLALRALATLNCSRQELGSILRLMRLHPDLQGTEMSVFPPSRRREIHEEYRESNRDLRKQFVDGVDADFFDEPQLGDDADWHAAVGDEATIVRDVIVSFAKHALRLERLNDARLERQREERLTLRPTRNATT